MIKKIYVDMDGVLVDLSRTLAFYDGYEDQTTWIMDKIESGVSIWDMYFESMERHIDDGVFKNADPMENYIDLICTLLEIRDNYPDVEFEILSSKCSVHYSDKIEQQKLEWLKRNVSKFHLFSDYHFTTSGKSKLEYLKAEPDSILIDDNKRLLGNGHDEQIILYRTISGVLEKLKLMFPIEECETF